MIMLIIEDEKNGAPAFQVAPSFEPKFPERVALLNSCPREEAD
jgi:hypothetical protein